MYFIKASFGNDSVALIQLVREMDLPDVTVIYSDTGRAAKWWKPRVEAGFELCRNYGFKTAHIMSEGFEALARRKKGFPRQGIQFCTEELKINPSKIWMTANDPNKEAVVCVGKRREESSNRARTEEFVVDHDESSPDGGRLLWHPLVAVLEPERNDLVRRAGFDPLPHRSKECYPCINSNRADLLALDADRVNEIEVLEKDMGFTKKGAPRTLFRPYRYMGATGIREIVQWAHSPRGKFESLDDGTGGDCYSGQCGL